MSRKKRPNHCRVEKCSYSSAALYPSLSAKWAESGITVHGIRLEEIFPEVPTMLKFPTLPLLRKSNNVRPTTPTFLSDPDMPPPTKPVVYSPVPTYLGLADSHTSDVGPYHQNVQRSHIASGLL
jgi:hypothetical protein